MRWSSNRRLGLVLAVLMAVLLVPALALAAPVQIDDTEIPPWSYSGSGWTTFSSSLFIGGSNHFTGTPGDYAEVKFTGTTVTLYSVKAFNRGTARIFLDGVDEGTISQYDAGVLPSAPVWTKSDLDPVEHTLRVVHDDAAGIFVEVDAIEYDLIIPPPVIGSDSSAWWSIALLGVAALGAVTISRRRFAR